MTAAARVVVDGATLRERAGEQVVELRTFGRNPNIRCRGDEFPKTLLAALTPRLEDLLRLAAIVFAADTRVDRGSETDVFGQNWVRRFRVAVPVNDFDYWQQEQVRQDLSAVLSFLSEDDWAFEFRRLRHNEPAQPFLFSVCEGAPPQDVDLVIPFSGGADSLAASVQAIGEGRRPVLVSHRPAPVIDSRQKSLAAALRRAFPQWSFPHLSVWVNRHGGPRAIEHTQRTRSFLYSALAAIVAALLRVDEIRLCDNGVVSINLPQAGQNVGALASRSTHPHFLELVAGFLGRVLDRPQLRFHNTLLFRTKAEVLALIAASGRPELIEESVSCAHHEGKALLRRHCGLCSQCIDRRFASVAARVEQFDPVAKYESDIFVDALQDGFDRTRVENYARFADTMERLTTPDAFFLEFPELGDCLPSGHVNLGVFCRRLWALFRRHQLYVNSAIERKIAEHRQELRRGLLPETSLLRMVSSGAHVKDRRERYARKLGDLLARGLPPIFQDNPPSNERQVQSAGEGIFITAKQTLNRETPQLPFSVISTKPDFSTQGGGRDGLFLEFKLLKSRTALNRLHTEMTSRVLIYRQQGAAVLFVVYDSGHAIQNDAVFVGTFEREVDVWVTLVR